MIWPALIILAAFVVALAFVVVVELRLARIAKMGRRPMSWLHLHIFNFGANFGLLAAVGGWLPVVGMLACAAGIALNVFRPAS